MGCSASRAARPLGVLVASMSLMPWPLSTAPSLTPPSTKGCSASSCCSSQAAARRVDAAHAVAAVHRPKPDAHPPPWSEQQLDLQGRSAGCARPPLCPGRLPSSRRCGSCHGCRPPPQARRRPPPWGEQQLDLQGRSRGVHPPSPPPRTPSVVAMPLEAWPPPGSSSILATTATGSTPKATGSSPPS
uniref:Uncharacterized protein n=1 Tax=Arundo donax TaxID=35708 RepID=A0A0A8ZIR9_ARUDO